MPALNQQNVNQYAANFNANIHFNNNILPKLNMFLNPIIPQLQNYTIQNNQKCQNAVCRLSFHFHFDPTLQALHQFRNAIWVEVSNCSNKTLFFYVPFIQDLRLGVFASFDLAPHYQNVTYPEAYTFYDQWNIPVISKVVVDTNLNAAYLVNQMQQNMQILCPL